MYLFALLTAFCVWLLGRAWLPVTRSGNVITPPTLPFGTARNATDGATTNASPTVTSPALAQFTSADIGKTISGAGIPAATTIIAVASLTSATMSANATATASGVTITIGPNPAVPFTEFLGNERYQVTSGGVAYVGVIVGVNVRPGETGYDVVMKGVQDVNKNLVAEQMTLDSASITAIVAAPW